MGRFLTLMKSGIMLDLYWLKNNRASFISMMLWPYLMLGLVLGMGFIFGSSEAFQRNIGLKVNPITYFVASTVVVMACLGIMWDVGGNVLFLKWIGALPYVIVAPHRISMTLILSYIPRYLFLTMFQLLEFIPLIFLVEGIKQGIFKLGVMVLALTLGMLPLLGFSALFAIVFMVTGEEESNLLSWLNPLILLFSGAFYPVALLPYWAQLIAWALPSTYTIELARLSALMGSPRFAQIIFLMGILLGMAMFYNLVAYSFIGVGERRALKKGAL
ncbi:MAG: hypothetical protein DRN15_02880 [Thermoprotei archaeon]|nr:MAG: hypothetical protein DRN15_02880 [Thermoprotei archaeon]